MHHRRRTRTYQARRAQEESEQVSPIQQSDYIELYYFTNKGLAEAETSSRSGDNDAFTLTHDKNSHHSFIPITAAKVKDSVIPDKDLTWVEFDEAAPRLLQAMRKNNWDEEQVQSHLQMWMALSAHEYCHDPDEFGKRALIVYQDTARRRWHALLGTPQSFDLVPINKGIIKELRDDLLHKANKVLRDEAIQVRSKCFTSQRQHPLTSPPNPPAPQPPLLHSITAMPWLHAKPL
ncbi:hypothetical protein PAXRUDRAFT_172247 [Paxillus rubicundulus Ve08.2h10]|uniref:Uncharacterized protein n=1 Tax=Paxillus rubicundulus Ve08.2h10 TaxID=930991 RepID=A0A0D0D683_9AGAM|nr:hypothetical protein PAXRUDRAFT_172247 [Paxillus rubicundulus Ve08.2h10]